MYSFLHVPVQAASNSVLLEMNREYTIEEFNRVVDLLYVSTGPRCIVLYTAYSNAEP